MEKRVFNSSMSRKKKSLLSISTFISMLAYSMMMNKLYQHLHLCKVRAALACAFSRKSKPLTLSWPTLYVHNSAMLISQIVSEIISSVQWCSQGDLAWHMPAQMFVVPCHSRLIYSNRMVKYSTKSNTVLRQSADQIMLYQDFHHLQFLFLYWYIVQTSATSVIFSVTLFLTLCFRFDQQSFAIKNFPRSMVTKYV